jgi:tetratricopeptide (TPR) repeat protein
MKRWAWLAALLSLATLGCQSAGGARVQSNVRLFEEERSPARLAERGRAFAAVGDTTRAEEYFSAALDAGGDDAQLTGALLSVCIGDGRYRMAIEHARHYVGRHPADMKARFILGTLYAAVGESRAAREELERVASVDSEDPEVHYALAVVLRDGGGDALGVDRHFRAYLRLAPRGEHADEARGSLLQEVP